MKSIPAFGVLIWSCGNVAAAAVANRNEIVLTNFSHPSGPWLAMETLDDPVMGGKSKSDCHRVDGSWLLWQGVVETVDFLKAPGFCTVQTKGHQDFSVLSNTYEISFYVDKSASVYFHPMGVQVNNRLHTALRIPITYWAELEEEPVSANVASLWGASDHVVRLFAPWSKFTAMIYGRTIPAPPLDDPEELSSVYRVGLTTYFGHETGEFSIKLLAITGTVSNTE